jgi:hypothetical protein
VGGFADVRGAAQLRSRGNLQMSKLHVLRRIEEASKRLFSKMLLRERIAGLTSF